MLQGIHFGILITSDRSASGGREDKTLPRLRGYIEQHQGTVVDTQIVPDDYDCIVDLLLTWSKRGDVEVILTSGGTGIAERDVTVDATLDCLEKELPGFGEEMRRRSLEKTPFAILSRATAGTVGSTLVINLPGSPKGAEECLSFIAKPLAHAEEVLKKKPHEDL